jgi:hypothetical protein
LLLIEAVPKADQVVGRCDRRVTDALLSFFDVRRYAALLVDVAYVVFLATRTARKRNRGFRRVCSSGNYYPGGIAPDATDTATTTSIWCKGVDETIRTTPIE